LLPAVLLLSASRGVSNWAEFRSAYNKQNADAMEDTMLGVRSHRVAPGSMAGEPVQLMTMRTNKDGFIAAVRRAVVLLTAVACGGCRTLHHDPGENVIAARQMTLRGLDSLEEGQYEKAEKWFGKAVETNPVDERAHLQYGELLWRRGDKDSAIRHLEESVKLSGGDPVLQIRLGEMYLARGDTELAWEQAEKALQSNRQLACAWALKGDVHRQRGEFDHALADYHRSLSYKGYCPHVQLGLAAIYREQNRPRRALATLEVMGEHYSPDDGPVELLIEQGLALKALGRYDRAVEVLTAATRRGNPSADLLYQLAEAQLAAGDKAGARLALVAALSQQPTHGPSQKLSQRINRDNAPMTVAIERF